MSIHQAEQGLQRIYRPRSALFNPVLCKHPNKYENMPTSSKLDKAVAATFQQQPSVWPAVPCDLVVHQDLLYVLWNLLLNRQRVHSRHKMSCKPHAALSTGISCCFLKKYDPGATDTDCRHQISSFRRSSGGQFLARTAVPPTHVVRLTIISQDD